MQRGEMAFGGDLLALYQVVLHLSKREKKNGKDKNVGYKTGVRHRLNRTKYPTFMGRKPHPSTPSFFSMALENQVETGFLKALPQMYFHYRRRTCSYSHSRQGNLWSLNKQFN